MDMTEQPGLQPVQDATTNGNGAPSPPTPPKAVETTEAGEGAPLESVTAEADEHQTPTSPADASAQKSSAVAVAAAAGGKGDSEAETEILSDKEDGTKRKDRKAIKLEQPDTTTTPDGDAADANLDLETSKSNTSKVLDPAVRLGARQASLKRKRGAEDPSGSDDQHEGDSSKLSSTISSPVIDRRPSEEIDSKSDHSESSPPFDDGPQPAHSSPNNDPNRHEKPNAIKHQITKEQVNGRKRRETRSATDLDESVNRSTSPPPRKPKRAQSSQSNPPQVQGVKRKRKAPAPLHVDRRSRASEDAHDSDSSSVRSHSRTQPPNSAAVESNGMWRGTASKLSTKKNKDRSGRTLLARACAIDFEEARKWLLERPEDIDVADNAGNTPLQIASLEGSADIVKLLLDHGCRTDCRNVDNDTPLIDAVENGHLEVVRLLLAAGVDPTQRNATGKEPIELVSSDLDDFQEIRESLLASKKEREGRRRQSEDQTRIQNSSSRDPDSTLSINSGPSPTHSTRSPPLDASRRRTARSQHTNDSLLWVNPTPQRLRDAAGKGDMAIVNHILGMRPVANTEAVLAAAQGGHDDILGLILALAQPEPDPSPLASPDLKEGHTTPMLAAIGRGNVRIIKLLLDQHGFNPTRRLYNGLTYYEIAKERQSSEWREEYDILKEAYDQYKKHGGKRSNQSTPQKTRTKRNDSRRSSPDPSTSAQEVRKIRKPQPSIKDEPDAEPKRKPSYQGTALRHPDENRKKSAASSDHELDVPKRKERVRSRVRSASPSQESNPKPKRRLVSGNDVKTDQEARRKLLAAETLHRRKSGESIGGYGEKHRRLSDASTSVPPIKATSESPNRLKEDSRKRRLRNSVSPQTNRSDVGEVTRKKKRLRIDSQGNSAEQDVANTSQPSMIPSASMVPSPPPTSAPNTAQSSGSAAPVAFMGSGTSSPGTKSAPKDSPVDSSSRSAPASPTGSTNQTERKVGDTIEGAAEPPAIADTIMKDAEEEERERMAHMEKEKADREEAEAREREEAELQRQIQREKEEAERVARVAREREEARIEEERRIQREREEAEALQAKKRREEEMQKRRAEQERQRREEQERRRREAEEREALRLMKLQQEEERLRRESLPCGLRRYLELNADEARSSKEISKWLPLRTVMTRDIEPGCDATVADERWIANVQAAPLLANKDLELSQYTAWTRRSATANHQESLWRQLRNPMSQASPLAAFVSSTQAFALDHENRPKFLALNVSWIKLSEFMEIVPRHPHLAGIRFTTRDFVLQNWPFGIVSPSLHGLSAQNEVKGLGIKDEAGGDGQSLPLINGNGALAPASQPLTNGFR